MLMLRSTHKRIVARLEQDIRDINRGYYARLDERVGLQRENADLRAKLDRFTGPRARGEDGRFLKGGGQ